MRLSVAVMAHPSRHNQAMPLLARLRDQRPKRVIHGPIGVVWDPQPGWPASAWRTAQVAWGVTPPKASHRLVIQDDAIVCDRFLEAAVMVLEARPDALVAFYLGSGHASARSYLALAGVCRRYAPLPLGHFIPTVALAMPVEAARGLTPWALRQMGAGGWTFDDEAIGRYRASQGLEAVATIPSLVQHDNDPESVQGHASHGPRVAACYIDQTDPTTLDWTEA